MKDEVGYMVLNQIDIGLQCIEAYWFPQKLSDDKEIELIQLLLQKHPGCMIKQCDKNELKMVKKAKLCQEKLRSQN